MPGDDRGAERAVADESERGTREIVDRMVEIAELSGCGPAARTHRITISDQAPTQRKNQRKSMLGHRVDGVATDVANGNTTIGASLDIDDVGSGRRDRRVVASDRDFARPTGLQSAFNQCIPKILRDVRLFAGCLPNKCSSGRQ